MHETMEIIQGQNEGHVLDVYEDSLITNISYMVEF
jgi:hypothetical protein